MTYAEARALVAQFEARTLPKERWTHEAHLTVGLWYVLHEPVPEALRLLRGGICSYNEAVGTANTATSGYHETITRFFIVAIARHVALAETDDFETLASTLLSGPCGDSRAPLSHWTKERLMSPEARAKWTPPDLLPLTP